MFSSTIFKQSLKANGRMWIIFTAVTSLLLTVLIAVFEPSTISGVTDMVEGTVLADLLKNTTFLGMMSSTFFTLHGVILPIVYIIITANSLVAAQVDRGSMAYLLSTPIKRTTVVRTQAFYLFTALLTMFLVFTLVGVTAIQIFQGDVDVSISDYLLLNIGLFLLMFATSGISFLFSCMFNLSKHSLALGGGIPIAFFLFDLMASVSEDLEYFKYLTINTLFPKDAILDGESFILYFVILTVVGVVLYGIGIRIFKERDLPL